VFFTRSSSFFFILPIYKKNKQSRQPHIILYISSKYTAYRQSIAKKDPKVILYKYRKTINKNVEPDKEKRIKEIVTTHKRKERNQSNYWRSLSAKRTHSSGTRSGTKI
jgi:hypothetical protein